MRIVRLIAAAFLISASALITVGVRAQVRRPAEVSC